jgi:hypothetical protein
LWTLLGTAAAFGFSAVLFLAGAWMVLRLRVDGTTVAPG